MLVGIPAGGWYYCGWFL